MPSSHPLSLTPILLFLNIPRDSPPSPPTLQPAQAAVYGIIVGAKAGGQTKVQVTVAEAGGANGAASSYTVEAVVDVTSKTAAAGGLYARWKAILHPADAGGNYTVTAACTGCTAPGSTAAIEDVTFGDVWFCR